MNEAPSQAGDGAEEKPTRATPRIKATNPHVQLALVNLGERIRQARVSRDMTLKDLASQMNLNEHTLGRLEKGAPGVAVETLALALWQMDLLEHLDLVADPERDESGQRLLAARAPKRARGAKRSNDPGFDILDKL